MVGFHAKSFAYIYTLQVYFIAEVLCHVVRGEFWGGAGRILLSAAVLASLGLEEAVVGSDVFMGLWDHRHVHFFLREWWPCPLLFFLSQGWWPLPVALFSHNVICRVGGLCPYPHSFSSAWCLCVAKQEGGAGELDGGPVCGVSCVTPVCGACCGR